MNQQELQPIDPGHAKPPRRSGPTMSRLAIVAFTLSLVPCCPLVSVLGAMLGIAALRRIAAANGVLRGRRLSQAAIVLGLAIGAGSMILFSTFGSYVQRTNQRIMTSEISDSMTAAVSGNVSEFEKFWTSDARAAMTPEMIQKFGAEASGRYGKFRRFTIASISTTGMLEQQYQVAGIFVFENRELIGSVQFNVQAAYGEIWPQFRLKSLLLEDRDAGDLRLPNPPQP